jgi:hypothetical protein
LKRATIRSRTCTAAVDAEATGAASGSGAESTAGAADRVATTPREPATNRLTRTMATNARPTALSALG